jgi:hypothetical protein
MSSYQTIFIWTCENGLLYIYQWCCGVGGRLSEVCCVCATLDASRWSRGMRLGADTGGSEVLVAGGERLGLGGVSRGGESRAGRGRCGTRERARARRSAPRPGSARSVSSRACQGAGQATGKQAKKRKTQASNIDGEMCPPVRWSRVPCGEPCGTEVGCTSQVESHLLVIVRPYMRVTLKAPPPRTSI